MKLFFIILMFFFSLPGLCREDEKRTSKDVVKDDQAILQDIFKESEIRKQSPELIRAFLRGKIVPGSPLEMVVDEFPILLDIAADIVKDEEAFPALMMIFTRKKALKSYGLIWVALIIVGGLVGRKILPSNEAPFVLRVMMRLCFGLLMSCISLGIFYEMFKAEVEPTVQIILKHLKI